MSSPEKPIDCNKNPAASVKTPMKERLVDCFAEEEGHLDKEKFITSAGTSHTFKTPESSKHKSSSALLCTRRSLWDQLGDSKGNKEQTGTCLAEQDKRHSADWFSKYENPATSTHDSKVKQTFLKGSLLNSDLSMSSPEKAIDCNKNPAASVKTPMKERLVDCFAEEEGHLDKEKFITSAGTSHTFKTPESSKHKSSSALLCTRRSLWDKLGDSKGNKEQTGTCLAEQDKRHSADWFSKYENPATSTHDSKVKQTFLKGSLLNSDLSMSSPEKAIDCNKNPAASDANEGKTCGLFRGGTSAEKEKFITSPGTSHTFKKPESSSALLCTRKSLWDVKEQLREGNKEQAKQEQLREGNKEQAKQDKRDWFSKYEKPATSTHDSKVKQTFLKVQDADKLRKTWRLCEQWSCDAESVVVCCAFDSDVERVGAYLSTKGVSAVKLHRNLPKLQQKSAEQNFKDQRVGIFVVTSWLLLRMNLSGKFFLVNFDLPVHFSDYKRLVAMSESAVTLINKGSAGMSLMKLVEEGIEIPDFVKQIADECHGRKQ